MKTKCIALIAIIGLSAFALGGCSTQARAERKGKAAGDQICKAKNANNANDVKIITFLVDPQEALILKFVKDSGGIIDFVVRSLDATQVNATDPVNIDYLVDLYKFISLPKK